MQKSKCKTALQSEKYTENETKILISKKDLLEIVKEYDEDRYEAEPVNASSYVEYIFTRMIIK